MLDIFNSGFTDYACNTHNWMNSVQTYQMDSINQTNQYIDLFRQAIENGLDPNDNAVKTAIQNCGTLEFNDLLPTDQNRLVKEVQKMMDNKKYF